MEDWSGQTLSKVKIQSLIARGGMAAVYLGQHITLNRPTAIKILHDYMADDAELLARFRAEAQSVAALRHPNIVQVFDFDVFNGRPYISMEFVKGVTLGQYLTDLHLRKKRLNKESMSKLVTSLASAMDYAHERGIIHRDIKPANIILQQGQYQILPGRPIPPDVEPILTDFGVARIRDATTHTAAGTILGTPAYMSPEQVSGKPIDHRSDIYSLGIILYEMLGGRPPFLADNDTPVSVLVKHLEEEPPPLPMHTPLIQAVVETSLAKDPAERYQTAGDLALALHAAIHPGSLSTPAPSPTPIPEPATEIQTAVGKAAVPAADEAKSTRSWVPLIGALGLIVLLLAVFFGTDLSSRFGALLTPDEEQADQISPTLEPSAIPSVEPPALTSTEQIVSTPFPILTNISGSLTLRDNSFQAIINGLDPAPANKVYRAWLASIDQENQNIYLNLNEVGAFGLSENSLTIGYTDLRNANLLSIYHSFVLSLDNLEDDPAQPTNELQRIPFGANLVARAHLADEVNRGAPISENLLDWLNRQAQHLSSHAKNAVNSISNNSLDGAKLHAEHTINIIAGREGNLFGDWNDDGRADNPGDPVGLMEYLLFLKGYAESVIQGQAGDEEFALTILDETERIIDLIKGTRETARQIALADTIELLRNLGLDQDIEAAIGYRDEISSLAEQAQSLDFFFYFPIPGP